MYNIDELRKAEQELIKRLDAVSAEFKKQLEAVREAIRILGNMNRQDGSIETLQTTIDFEISDEMNLLDAMKHIMQSRPEKWWRGAEMADRLQELGYGIQIKHFKSKVCNALKRYAKANVRRAAYFEKSIRGRYPRYRLAA